MCMCTDSPRAGLINEFTLPMWHCCDNQIPHQACSCPLGGGGERDRQRERESRLDNSRGTSVKLIPSKSLQWDLTHSHENTHTHILENAGHCVSRFNYITCSPAWILSSVHRSSQDVTRRPRVQKCFLNKLGLSSPSYLFPHRLLVGLQFRLGPCFAAWPFAIWPHLNLTHDSS